MTSQTETQIITALTTNLDWMKSYHCSICGPAIKLPAGGFIYLSGSRRTANLYGKITTRIALRMIKEGKLKGRYDADRAEVSIELPEITKEFAQLHGAKDWFYIRTKGELHSKFVPRANLPVDHEFAY